MIGFAGIGLVLLALNLAGAVVSHPRATAKSVGAPTDPLLTQVLLDRSHFSPGEIDAHYGRVTRTAIRAFQAAHGLAETGAPDPLTARALEADQQSVPVSVPYTISDGDMQGPFTIVPDDLMEQAKLEKLGYQSALEELAEKFHCSPKLLQRLNPDKDFSKAGEQIMVPNVHVDPPPKADSVVVFRSKSIVEALDANDKVLSAYPATIGSTHDPLPIGRWKVTHVTKDPIFYYNPNLFWDAPGSATKATIQPGPNNPAGVVWIGLTKEHYGIHGTPEPSLIGRVASHGCIRLTNWDAAELAGMVSRGTPVSFRE